MHDHATTTVLIALTGFMSLVLAGLAVGAWHRTGNRKLGFVAAAFWVFVVKSALTAYSLWTGFLGVVVVVLLIAPFLGGALRRPAAA
jgi:hypothetical protein